MIWLSVCLAWGCVSMAITYTDANVVELKSRGDSFTRQQIVRALSLGGAVLDGRITIPSAGPSGFDILISREYGAATGDFGGMVQEFHSVDEALNWAERCHRESYRLRIDRAGARPYQWTLEKVLPNGGHIDVMASGHTMLFRALQSKSVEYRANATALP